ncbi:TOP6B-like family protein [Streptomyces thinghirensis]|nr:TOP6B-like family protein [Streptomyces thinghirensis]
MERASRLIAQACQPRRPRDPRTHRRGEGLPRRCDPGAGSLAAGRRPGRPHELGEQVPDKGTATSSVHLTDQQAGKLGETGRRPRVR